MAYIEVFKGENADAIFMERLQHIDELHKQRLKSAASFESSSSDWDMPKPEQQDVGSVEKKCGQSTPQKKLSRQSEIDCDILEEVAYEHEVQNTDSKKDEDIIEESEEDPHDLNRNTSNNNFNSFAVGEKVLVQHESRYLFGHVRFIGSVLFTDKEQIGIELEQPYGERHYRTMASHVAKFVATNQFFTCMYMCKKRKTFSKVVFQPLLNHATT